MQHDESNTADPGQERAAPAELNRAIEQLDNGHPPPAMTVTMPALWTQRDLCAYLGKSIAWAERARWSGDGPPFVKVGRSIRYLPADVLAWMRSSTRKGTAA